MFDADHAVTIDTSANPTGSSIGRRKKGVSFEQSRIEAVPIVDGAFVGGGGTVQARLSYWDTLILNDGIAEAAAAQISLDKRSYTAIRRAGALAALSADSAARRRLVELQQAHAELVDQVVNDDAGIDVAQRFTQGSISGTQKPACQISGPTSSAARDAAAILKRPLAFSVPRKSKRLRTALEVPRSAAFGERSDDDDNGRSDTSGEEDEPQSDDDGRSNAGGEEVQMEHIDRQSDAGSEEGQMDSDQTARRSDARDRETQSAPTIYSPDLLARIQQAVEEHPRWSDLPTSDAAQQSPASTDIPMAEDARIRRLASAPASAGLDGLGVSLEVHLRSFGPAETEDGQLGAAAGVGRPSAAELAIPSPVSRLRRPIAADRHASLAERHTRLGC